MQKYFQKGLISFLLLTFVGLAYAQPSPPLDIYGKELRIWLKENWFNGYHTSLGYNTASGARGRMYNYIDNIDGQVEDLYGGYISFIEYGGTITNPENGKVNCEHIVPQSFFINGLNTAPDPMRSDIHHLSLALGKWNSTRSNHPYDNINDQDVDKWMLDEQDYFSIPAENTGVYSKFSGKGNYQRFEPRDKVKGNIARAILYFYTMYEDHPDVTRGIEEVIGQGNLQILLDWHVLDPVDAVDRERNNNVEYWQGNRNPYVDFAILVERAWFMDGPGGGVVAASQAELATNFSIYPNPSTDTFYIDSKQAGKTYSYQLLSVSGQKIVESTPSMGKSALSVSSLQSGIYLLVINTEEGSFTSRVVIK